MNELVRRHYAAVFRVALGIVSDRDVAADVTQDTFVKVVKGLTRFREQATFKTWVLAIAANEARGQLRRTGRRGEKPLDLSAPVHGDNPDPVRDLVHRQMSDRVRMALERLPDKQRMAVSLRIYEGLSFREVGEVIGSSEGAARVNYHHGLKRLRESLNDE